jgi:ribosomal protein S12 methylthiotransferase
MEKLGANRKIIVGGCLTNWDKKERYFAKKYPLVDAWITTDDARNLAKHIKNLYDKHKELPGITTAVNAKFAPEYLYTDKTPRLQLTPPHFAYIKIADGCNNRCSYCTIPGIRGKLRSRKLDSVIREAENLIGNGVKELILTAQDITAFNHNSEDANLAALLRKLDSLKGDFMIRLLYAHPAHLSNELISIFAASKHILHYLDMPLQHISDRILLKMNRKVTSCEIREKLASLKNAVPDMAVRTTFMVGFPGETGKDFRELHDFVEEQRFARLGVFTYYPEPGTPAADMAGRVSAETAEKRRNSLMELQSAISLENNQRLIGKTLDVIIDRIDRAGTAFGRTYMDAPEIDNEVIIKKISSAVPGNTVRALITSASAYSLEARIST